MKKQITKQIDENTKLKIKISTDGIIKPYFSITGELREKNKYGRWELVSCGCLHEEIIKVAPELKPLVDIHLSDLDGVPMHAFENGWYWLAKACGIKETYEPNQSPEECFDIFCKHCRIDEKEANEVKFRVVENYKRWEKAGAKNEWSMTCDLYRPMWKKQAEEALKLIESIQE